MVEVQERDVGVCRSLNTQLELYRPGVDGLADLWTLQKVYAQALDGQIAVIFDQKYLVHLP